MILLGAAVILLGIYISMVTAVSIGCWTRFCLYSSGTAEADPKGVINI